MLLSISFIQNILDHHNLLKVIRMGMMLSQMKKEFTITKKKKERKPMVMKKMIEMKLFHIMDMKIAV